MGFGEVGGDGGGDGVGNVGGKVGGNGGGYGGGNGNGDGEKGDEFCKKYPKSLACAELGDAGDDEVPTNEREIRWEPDNRMASGGSCPADPRISLMGQNYTLEIFSLACEYISRYGRPVVLLIAAFISYIIVSGAFRQ